MYRHKWRAALGAAAAFALVSGCNRTDNEPGPGGVTVSEAKALNDAAEMLESRDTATAAAARPASDARDKADE
ncbi:hypothetical protein [Sphingopyxis sp.]|uniref:hypothetical protein n=1 Tax=Sphingopyxis sp. TaxID=1908224 RepID=UPI003D0B8624